MDWAGMRYHRHLEAERIRKMPWKTQVGMIASELSRAYHLAQQGGGPEVIGCLHRAKELLGILESSPILPREAVPVLCETAKALASSRIQGASAEAEILYHKLMALYKAPPIH